MTATFQVTAEVKSNLYTKSTGGSLGAHIGRLQFMKDSSKCVHLSIIHTYDMEFRKASLSSSTFYVALSIKMVLMWKVRRKKGWDFE